MLTPRRFFLLLCLLAAGLFPVAVIAYNHLGEDCHITFRYAEQWVRGHGIVYNIGDRVEGYSNFLWVACMAGGRLLGISPLLASRWLSVAVHAALVLLLGWGLSRRIALRADDPAQPRIPWYCLWLPLALWVNPLLHYHCDRGLETVLFAALLAFALVAVVQRRWLAGGILLGMASITRPEGIAYAAAMLPWVIGELDTEDSHLINSYSLAKGRERLRRLALFFLPVLAIFLSHLLFRRLYYGMWIPNTAMAKLGRGERPSALPEMLRWILATNGLPFLALAGAVAGWIRLPDRRRLIAVSVFAFAAALAYQLAVGQVAAVAYRYLIPAIVPMLILVAMLLEALHFSCAGKPFLRRAFPILLLAGSFYLHSHSGADNAWFAGHGDAPRSRFHHRLWEFLREPHWRERWQGFHAESISINAEAGRWLRYELAPRHPPALLAADQMGELGYHASWDQTIIDLGGLMDCEIARNGLGAADLLRRNPDYLVLYSWRCDSQPLLPELRALCADPEFLQRYTPRWRLQPRDDIQQVEFVVWARRGSEESGPPAIVPLGPTTEEFERAWRILSPAR